ncbi:MAG TPA: TIGR02996 domain-containing protein, partial [Gemmataceae bacterium]|nr:TIGR02996 domain-containing protein [Gemmataceae bacterium]
MSQDEGFLQAIIEEPDDVGLRLIFADWLDERGDPRGEFIRVQCLLEEIEEDDPRRVELKTRERELLAAHEREWLGELDGRVSKWTFRRGFVEHVSVHAPLFVTEAEKLFRQTPLRSAHLFGALEAAKELAGCPFLARLRRLDLR